MPHVVNAECPVCGKTANGYNEIEEKFGWRFVNGKKIPQSYCIACRSKHKKRR